MHEVGIIRKVIDMVEGEARSRGAARITKIRLRVGESAGVSGKSLKLAFDAIKPHTLARDAKLEIETVRLSARCNGCGKVEISANDVNPLCPDCGGALEIVAGKELQVESIDLEHE